MPHDVATGFDGNHLSAGGPDPRSPLSPPSESSLVRHMYEQGPLTG